MLLILASRGDLAADYLIVKLKEKRIPYVRFNTEDYPDNAQIALDNRSGHWQWRLTLRGNRYESSDFSAVYLRHLQVGSCAGIPDSDREFVAQEVAETLKSLWRVIPDQMWLNHPRDVWLASNKVLQLVTACDLGFLVPPTLVTNSVDEVEVFAADAAEGGLIAKAVKHGFTALDGRMVLAGTRVVSAADLRGKGVATKVPLLIQERLATRYDVRVVVVGDDVFPVRIHSDVSAGATPDWRLQQLEGQELFHEPFQLPPEVEQRCRGIPARFGLKYSSLDLIEDLDGNFWFLELNPNGQWAWIEQLGGHPIRDSIIRALGF
jgi:hypothetical protein